MAGDGRTTVAHRCELIPCTVGNGTVQVFGEPACMAVMIHYIPGGQRHFIEMHILRFDPAAFAFGGVQNFRASRPQGGKPVIIQTDFPADRSDSDIAKHGIHEIGTGQPQLLPISCPAFPG